MDPLGFFISEIEDGTEEPAKLLSQNLQKPLIKEYTLNYNRIPNMIYKVYSLIKEYILNYSRIPNMI